MSNPLYGLLNNNQPPAMANLQNALSQIKANPAQLLSRAGYNVPMGMSDPSQIINHLVQSGQINQQRLAQAQQMASMIKR